MEAVAYCIFLISKITVDGDCSHEIKRHLLLGNKAMTNLDTILKILPPTFVYSSATAMGRQGSSRAAEMRGSGAGRAARRPSGRQRSCRPNKLQPDHAVGEVFQQPRNFPECWRRGRKGVPDWPFPAHLARPRCDWRDGV